MAKYPGVTLTNAGINMIAESQGDGQLIFTSIKLGDGSLADGEDIKALTAVKNPILTANISTIDANTAGQVSLTTIISNAAVNTGFFAREIGVYAKIGSDGTEQLYAYSNAGNYADYMPDKSTPVDENKIKITMIVGNAANISAVINGSIVYLTAQEVESSIITAINTHNADSASHKVLMDHHNTDAAAHADIRAAIKNVDLSPYAKLVSPSFIGTPTVPTSSPFDGDTQIMNGASIMLAANCVRNASYHSSNYTLTTADNGCLVGFSGSGVTATLPVPTNNSKYYIANMDTTSNLTIVSSASIFSAKYGWGDKSITVPPKTTVCVADSSYHTWIIYASDTTAATSGTAATNTAWYDTATGILFQWGVVSGATEPQNISFPMAFTTCFIVMASNMVPADSVTTSVYNVNNTYFTIDKTHAFSWMAIGKA